MDMSSSVQYSHKLAATYFLDAIRKAPLGLVPPAISVPLPAPRLVPFLYIPHILILEHASGLPGGQVVPDAEL